MRKILIILVVIIVLAGAIFLRLSTRGSKKETVDSAMAVEVVPAARGSVTSTCELIGAITADKTAQVFPEAMGRVTRILVKEGAYVSKNSRIMAIKNETIGFEYEEGYIKSPISGNVAEVLVDVGSMVTPQAPVATVMDYARVKVAFNMAESDFGSVSKKNKVYVEVDALPGQTFDARISEISPVIDPYTRTVGIKANINNSRKTLKPGMTARVTINLGDKDDVLCIAKDAVLDGYLFVVKDSTAERRDVVVGLIGDEYVEIIEGIEEGENVVVIGQQRLAGGERVAPLLRSKYENN